MQLIDIFGHVIIILINFLGLPLGQDNQQRIWTIAEGKVSLLMSINKDYIDNVADSQREYKYSFSRILSVNFLFLITYPTRRPFAPTVAQHIFLEKCLAS